MRLPTTYDAGGQPAAAGQAKEPSQRDERGGVLKGRSDRIPMPMMLIFSALMDASRT